ncbi:MAG TPA: FtsK/SpoIIIE domain-containing protein, partial [Jatrophihabitantaceae bacterium]|nr:FtsK/SpoIIIE domain-containing protein [Jatrophihabitantaceae bacterium]
ADHPREQRRETIVLDLAAGDAIGIVGSARSGRTTTLVSLAIAAAARLSPDDCAMYLLDGGSGELHAIAALPHVASCASWRDADHLARLVLRLAAEVAGRRSRQHRSDAFRAVADDSSARVAALLVVIDGWETCARVLDDHDGGESSAALLGLIRAGPSAGVTVVVSGDRELLAVRLAGSLTTRYALRLADRSDYALVGVAPAEVDTIMPPGRAVRGSDATSVQFAHAGSSSGLDAARDAAARITAPSGRPTRQSRRRVVVQALPRQLRLAELPLQDDRFVLGLGGDAADPMSIDLSGARARFVVGGPPGSGRTSVVRLVLHQAVRAGVPAVLFAPAHSPAYEDARRRGMPAVTPSDAAAAIPHGARLLLVDDPETFAATDVESALLALLTGGCALLVATSSTDLAVAHRGIVAEARKTRSGLLLSPRPADGEPFGVRLPRRNAEVIPGRGVLLCVGRDPVPIQVALPDDLTTYVGTGDPSAGRTSP